jgi:AcrR family transcriptional regulator
METLTPKKREILERETKILEVARPIVVREGYHGLNMDRIAEALNYSKGTIYNHFSCKEEVIIALAIQSASKRVELFRQAAQFQGRSRFRMMAIGEAAELFVREFTEFFLFEEIIQLPSVREKTSEKRQAVIDGCQTQCMSVVAGVVRDAVAQKDLTLPQDMSAEELVYGLWSLTTGAYSIMLKSDLATHFGMEDPFATVRRHVAAILDGYHWKPLSRNFDFEKIRRRIGSEVFDRE